jgi:TPP-dependent pyruvate/acetoin dehydrogenase alpha subunit
MARFSLKANDFQRLGPHAGVGDSHDISAEELKAAKEAWPVPRTRALLLEHEICTEAQLEEIEDARRPKS